MALVVLETTTDLRHPADQHRPADPPVDRHLRHDRCLGLRAAAVAGADLIRGTHEKPPLAVAFFHAARLEAIKAD
jgi:hypothetical protein